MSYSSLSSHEQVQPAIVLIYDAILQPLIMSYSSLLSSLSSHEQVQQHGRRIIASLTERGIWPPQDGQILSMIVPMDGGKDAVCPASKVKEMPVAKKVVAVMEGEECSICLNGYKIKSKVMVLPCAHCYHSGCIDKWLRMHRSCPICRYEIPMDKEAAQRQGSARHVLARFVYGHRPETNG